MPRLTRAADRSVLWIAIAGALALEPAATRPAAAVRGLASIAVTSLVANQVSKRLHRRPVPRSRRCPRSAAHRIPTSTSFPSGHSASAMAFAAGASAEWPALSVPLRALAGLVGFSRVATGAHYPGDVAAGFALGEAIAWLTTKVVRVERTDRVDRRTHGPRGEPNVDGEGITLSTPGPPRAARGDPARCGARSRD
jgi:undecaprenyl-diphosphatase